MDAQNDINRGKFTWKISYFTEQDAKMLYSEAFTVSSCKWRILVYPKGNGSDHLSLFLGVPDSATLPCGWTRAAKFSLGVIDQVNDVPSIRREGQNGFTAREKNWGFTSFIPLTELHNCTGRCLANDTLVIKAEVCILTVTSPVNIQPARPTDKFDSYFTGLHEFVNGAETHGVRVGARKSSDFLAFEQDNAEFELHELQRDQRFSAMKKSQETHILYKQLMDDLIKEEKELKRKTWEVKSRKDKLLSDWEILLVESEEAKLV
ncbi:MATH domain and coiled-coil domain-containing protein At3g58250-like [Eucalyptus grandis]|uniref:MATH domain and coiled-coil domain-containing protein At3g58250-like n=1 Tax=Eucalyptus grandis TaxID=71139 RepID=UPI00192EC49C|nr:MATH domain and coiled-coil domain-containing protein At3g58250-like [Eucalyptus grandis]